MKKYITAFILCSIMIYSCTSDDYKIDGGISDPYVNKSTYDYLASNPLFDTLVIAINKAGIKDMFDHKETTLFAPTNYAIRKHIDMKTVEGRALYNDPNYKYQFDSIPVQVLRDSLPMYLFKGTFDRSNMTPEGDVVKSYAGTELRLSLEPRKDYTGELPENPKYVYLTYKRGQKWDDWDASDVAANEIDWKVRAQTSGLISTTGIIHVLENKHTLFFKDK